MIELLAHPQHPVKEFFEGVVLLWTAMTATGQGVAGFVTGMAFTVFLYWLLKKKLGLIR